MDSRLSSREVDVKCNGYPDENKARHLATDHQDITRISLSLVPELKYSGENLCRACKKEFINFKAGRRKTSRTLSKYRKGLIRQIQVTEDASAPEDKKASALKEIGDLVNGMKTEFSFSDDECASFVETIRRNLAIIA
jgi:hypothetical protein